jgi:hypothetical protein
MARGQRDVSTDSRLISLPGFPAKLLEEQHEKANGCWAELSIAAQGSKKQHCFNTMRSATRIGRDFIKYVT